MKQAASQEPRINDESIEAVAAARFSRQFLRPLHESYCFSRIPATLFKLLTGAPPPGQSTLPAAALMGLQEQYDKVLFLFIDALGWRLLNRHLERNAFLRRLAAQGILSKITAQFPSTTATHVTTAHTGHDLARSGIWEWVYYDYRVEELINILLFSPAGHRQREQLLQNGVRPELLIPDGWFYPGLVQAGVRPYVLQFKDYVDTSFSRAVCRQAERIPYTTITAGLSTAAEIFQRRGERQYVFFYIDEIDQAAHHHGADWPGVDELVTSLMAGIERCLFAPLQKCRERVLVTIAADHGTMSADPQRTFYPDREFPELPNLIRRGPDNRRLAPAGSPTDMFLYLNGDSTANVIELLNRNLAGSAEVWATQDLLQRGFFGAGELSAAFLRNMPEAIVLPYDGHTIWWAGDSGKQLHLHGYHGGLTPVQMESIFLAVETV